MRPLPTLLVTLTAFSLGVTVKHVYFSPAPIRPAFTCQKKTCSQIASCDEAFFLLRECGVTRLDRDQDGVPCDMRCQ